MNSNILAIKGEMSDLNKSNAGHYYLRSVQVMQVSVVLFVNKNTKKLDLTVFDQEEVLLLVP